MAVHCDKCSASADIIAVEIQTTTGVRAKADLCPDCVASLETSIESLGFTIPEEKPGGLGAAG